MNSSRNDHFVSNDYVDMQKATTATTATTLTQSIFASINCKTRKKEHRKIVLLFAFYDNVVVQRATSIYLYI